MNSEFNPELNDLIHDPKFQEWVLRPTPELDLYWKKFAAGHPLREKDVEEAAAFIRQLIPVEKEMGAEAVADLWDRIEADTLSKKRKLPRMLQWTVAAGLMLAIGVSGVMYFKSGETVAPSVNYQSIAKADNTGSDVKLIFSDQSEEILKESDVEIKYNSLGDITVNADRKLTQKTDQEKAEKEMLNQLVVPFGKRTNLTLSDGTNLYLNSGSRAIFPVVFNKKNREIFIEGEAYLEVAHDAAKPFVVVTEKMRIEVLGTKFNVAAYPEDQSASVVLVEGGVQAIVNSRKMVMKPNQRLLFEKSTQSTSLETTDILPYVSWKDGWMYCSKESLESIAIKLSRYYNVRIQFTDDDSKKMSLTGKLDLKNECGEIFQAISSTAPISCEQQDDTFIISKKR